LDEATSSLDNLKEKEIQNILENGLREKTVIVIAHRLSTIRNCDRIIVLDNGKIVQDGNHDALVTDTSGIYYKMLNSHEVGTKMNIDQVVELQESLDQNKN
jgi:ATP-binding cassette subfamily B protein